VHVIATAGHVDHGKSTLIRALTGIEPDRWSEEQRRGMTIDLGYAWTRMPGGETVTFVDVPGHQRFITNMLAGLGSVPAVLFVVAADDGWCRQSGEHLAALDALGVRHGLLAVTRADLYDPGLAIEEAREYLKGTTLAEIEAVAVSAVTGQGLDALKAALSRLVHQLPTPAPTPATRLWVDRVFSIRGAGTVLTGTLSSGRVAVGDELILAPSGRTVRVRGLECLKEPADEAAAVARVAVNVRGVGTDEVKRGDALLAPALWTSADVLDVRLLSFPEKMPAQAILHIGSAAVQARVRMLGDDVARLSLSRPLPLHVGDRALLRDPGVQRIIAGVIVLDPVPPSIPRRGTKARAAQLALMPGNADPEDEVRRRNAVSRRQLEAMGVLLPDASVPAGARAVGSWIVAQGRWKEWLSGLSEVLDQWAGEHPLAPGTPRSTAVQRLGLPDQNILDSLIEDSPDVTSDAAGVHRRGASVTFSESVETALAGIAERLAAEPFAAPESEELGALGLTPQHLAAAVNVRRLTSVGKGIYLLPDGPEEAIRRIRELPQPFTLSAARQALGTTRRVAVPLLEFLDRAGLTHRVEADLRIVRSRT
jgi:selenocysteine-specific elongation factor